jgi:cell division protein FtsN
MGVASADVKPWEQQPTPEPVADEVIKQTVAQVTQTEDINKSKAIVIQASINEIEQSSKEGSFYVQVGSFVGEPKKDHIDAVTRNGFAI